MYHSQARIRKHEKFFLSDPGVSIGVELVIVVFALTVCWLILCTHTIATLQSRTTSVGGCTNFRHVFPGLEAASTAEQAFPSVVAS
jgi:hypothetical protein